MSDDSGTRRADPDAVVGGRVVRTIAAVGERLAAAPLSELRSRGFDDVTPAVVAAIVLVEAGGSRLADLRRLWGGSKQATSQIVGELRRRGYVDVVASRIDGRSKVVVLTGRGSALRDGGIEALERLSVEVSRILGPDATGFALALERLGSALAAANSGGDADDGR